VCQELLDEDLEDPGSCFCEQSIGDDVILCASCQRWCHPSCVGLSMVMIKVLSESEAPYVCPLCSVKILKERFINARKQHY
jgi:hypothetical protein